MRAFLGMGSNMGDSRENLAAARRGLQDNSVAILRTSEEEVTAPVGRLDQPAFHNQVLEIETALEPRDLLKLAKKLEERAGRTPGQGRWGPRTLDIDILIFGGLVFDSPELTIPHPQMVHRPFVLRELLQIDPDLVDPKSNRRLADILAEMTRR
jgi:2-amino-4-hydroxy-6-hydroxymethyldihydropteridine diphosphokinase